MTRNGVNVAQIGCGHWGKNLARNFAQIGVLAAVVDDDPATAQSIANQNGAQSRTFAEVLSDPSIDAIAIATPAATHASVALRAIAAKKHVFVEKPLALRPADAKAVVKAAAEAKVVLMVGHLLQYQPHFQELKKLVRSGGIGSLNYLYSNRLSFGKIRTEENVLWSFAPHDLSMILALADQVPERVGADGSATLNPAIADWCICTLAFPSGLRAHVQTSWLHPFKEQRLVAVGDRGMAVFEDSAPDWGKRLAVYPHRIEIIGNTPITTAALPQYIEVAEAEPLRDECIHFVEAIRNGTRPLTDGAEGLRVLEVLDRAEAQLAISLTRA